MASHRDPRELRWRKTIEISDQNKIEALAQAVSIPSLVAQVLFLRGIDDEEAARNYLNPKLADITPPDRILGISKAVQRLAQAKECSERIQVFSDYDVDGTCGGALMTRVLRELRFDASVTQPDRFRDGYGVSVQAVEKAHQEGFAVFITVDCGITSFAALERAKELNLDVIVVDHHQIDLERGLPPAYSIIDPHQAGCGSGLTQLCGCGLAYYLSIALRSYAREHKWLPPEQLPNLKAHLDLVTLATAADLVPLVRENRIFVHHGLEVLKRTTKPGLSALLEVSGLSKKELSPGHLGFTLGPRLNASGRMANAGIAMELLLTDDPARAWALAREIEQLNEDRMYLQNQIWDEVRERVESEIAEGQHPYAVVYADHKLHEGVIGIVASRVSEFFRKPSAVISLSEEKGKGSVRSFSGIDVLATLRECSSHLVSFGGHAFAAGLTLRPDQVESFKKDWNDSVGKRKDTHTLQPIFYDGYLDPKNSTTQIFLELERLAPFGPGNPEPVFIFEAMPLRFHWLKERHLKMWLTSPDTVSMGFEALWFNADQERVPELEEPVRFAVVPEINRFRGKITPQLRIRDFSNSTK